MKYVLTAVVTVLMFCSISIGAVTYKTIDRFGGGTISFDADPCVLTMQNGRWYLTAATPNDVNATRWLVVTSDYNYPPNKWTISNKGAVNIKILDANTATVGWWGSIRNPVGTYTIGYIFDANTLVINGADGTEIVTKKVQAIGRGSSASYEIADYNEAIIYYTGDVNAI